MVNRKGSTFVTGPMLILAISKMNNAFIDQLKRYKQWIRMTRLLTTASIGKCYYVTYGREREKLDLLITSQALVPLSHWVP